MFKPRSLYKVKKKLESLVDSAFSMLSQRL